MAVVDDLVIKHLNMGKIGFEIVTDCHNLCCTGIGSGTLLDFRLLDFLDLTHTDSRYSQTTPGGRCAASVRRFSLLFSQDP